MLTNLIYIYIYIYIQYLNRQSGSGLNFAAKPRERRRQESNPRHITWLAIALSNRPTIHYSIILIFVIIKITIPRPTHLRPHHPEQVLSRQLQQLSPHSRPPCARPERPHGPLTLRPHSIAPSPPPARPPAVARIGGRGGV